MMSGSLRVNPRPMLSVPNRKEGYIDGGEEERGEEGGGSESIKGGKEKEIST